MSRLSRSCIPLFVISTLIACGQDPVGGSRPDDPLGEPGASLGVLNATDAHPSRHIAILDDCDPTDPNWNATGGCVLRGGIVSEAEFGAQLASPLSQSVIGHPAWRNEPSYLRVDAGRTVRVTNLGGRNHSFTEVAQFGGGFVPPLNIGLTPAPECVPPPNTPNFVVPGGRIDLTNLSVGDHRYMCCIHPWMRALITVQ